MVKMLSKPASKKSSSGKSSSGKVSSRSKPKSTKSAALPKTFESKELEASFVHYCQLVCPKTKSQDEVVACVKRLSATEIDFMGHADFSLDSIETVLFKDGRLLPISGDELQRSKTPDLPAHLARLCETKLLTPAEEVETFRRMNYLRFRANQLRAELRADADVASEKTQAANCWTVRRIEALLKASDWYRDRLVKSNMRLVISIVKKFVNSHNGFDDLLSDGIIALMRAVDKFDVGLGYRFSTYATQVVRRNSYRRVMEKQKERQRVTVSVHDPGVDISDEHQVSERGLPMRKILGISALLLVVCVVTAVLSNSFL
ncbi:MAG: sigma-70 family RNA polymerase sigma factor, partial [Pirellula sp.]